VEASHISQGGSNGAVTSRNHKDDESESSGELETMENTKDFSRGGSVNLPELLERLENDRELLRDLLTIFKEDFPVRLQALQDAVAHQDLKRATVESHSLKGMLANLAVTKAAAAAAQLEELAHAGIQSSIDDALAAFEQEVQGLLPEMESYMVEVQT
jgi:HPt (histidine-containing phosphotransfer) domain-containing protein